MKRLLAAAPNFRDLGGLPTVDGRRLRAGCLYRSGALDELEPDDLAALGRLGIGFCLDLRSTGERRKHPSRWPEHAVPRTLAIEVATDIRALDRAAAQALIERPDAHGAAQLMRAVYRQLPQSCAPVLQALIRTLVEGSLPPTTVIHCTAGKDRTGFVVALLLTALGVTRADIEADYLETNRHYDAGRQDTKIAAILQEMFGVHLSTEGLQAITAARLDYLAAAFDSLDASWGGTARYLQECVGLDAASRCALREALLE
ncbi:MAG: tyrosine-protein phosphatase [Pseudomonadota bacterium]